MGAVIDVLNGAVGQVDVGIGAVGNGDVDSPAAMVGRGGPAAGDEALRRLEAGVRPSETTHHLRLDDEMSPAYAALCLTDAAGRLEEPFHQMAQHEVVVRHVVVGLPALRQRSGALLELISIARDVVVAVNLPYQL